MLYYVRTGCTSEKYAIFFFTEKGCQYREFKPGTGHKLVYDRTTETNQTETGIGSFWLSRFYRNNQTYRNLPKLPSRTEPIVSVRFGRFGSVSVHFGRSQSQMKGLVILHSKAQ